jgi:hypothetical protein
MTAAQGLNAAFLQPNYPPPIREQTLQGKTMWHDQEAILRKPSQCEGAIVPELSRARALFHRSQNMLDQDLVDMRKSYGFPANDSVVKFLANHRALSSVLLAAAPRLKEYFGHDSILNLEVSTDEDESQTLYAVTIWHEDAHTAAEALDQFEENWWLDHMTPNATDLAFTYKLA